MTTLITRLASIRAGARRALLLLVATLVALPLGAILSITPAQAHPGHGDTEPFKALLFSKTAAFRHGSIEAGIAAIEQLGAAHDFTVDATEDGADFTPENLAQYEVVIFLSTTGDVLDATQQAAFEDYIEAGGGYAGIHAASDTEYDWEWYGDLVGAYFEGHPAPQDVEIKVEDPAHPSTATMGPIWERNEELYNFRTNPRGKVHVLASYDESTYTGGTMGNEHPISWCQDYDGGRSWYTGMGHSDAAFAEPQFLDHLLGGIRTAAGVLPADCAATLPASFEKVTLDDNTSNPMELTIADDGRVFYIDRNGEVKVILPNGNVVTAGSIAVNTSQEFGLLGIALDPDFETNGWVYLYHSPAGAVPTDRVSRFTMDGNTMDVASKTDIIDIPTQRDQCCHAGGALEFDLDGDLYIATGDNTNPFDSSGYNPIDERAGRAAWDAQRSAGNTNVLNGKILRITPLDDGGYDIPEGNLFPEGTADTRPEIYGMGFRNPFRIGLDEQTNKLLVADYGPDAGNVNPNRGPDGRVEWNILTEPGNYGWPYCVGDNTPYNDYNFATSTSGPKFDCGAIENDSPNNTGLTLLPPAIEATMWQGKSSTGVPEIGGSGAPMTSGTYAYDEDNASPRKWPAYFDGKAIWADWNDDRLFTVQLNEDGTDYTDVNRFLPDLDMTRPHALQFGPDGALYMIEWGTGFGGSNADSGVYRIDYVQGNRAPIARATADKTSGPAPLTVAFDSEGSRDPDGATITYSWDFDGDGEPDSTEPAGSFTYTEVGDYTARLTVTDEGGRTAVSNLSITVGNTAPTVELVLPPAGGFFDFGDVLKYEVVVTDPEDSEIDCDNVVVQPALGHDEHAHGYDQYIGCEGSFPLPGDEGHVGANIFGTVTATYTDSGAPGVGSLQGTDTIVVHTKRKEAEYFDSTGRLEGSTSSGDAGVITEDTGDEAGGGQNAGFIEPGDWFAWDVMNLTNISEISMRAATGVGGATFEVRTGSPDGETVAEITIGDTGDWQVYDDFSAPVSGDSATVSGPLYFVETEGGANINWIDFVGRGITDNQRPDVTASADVLSGPGPLEVSFTASATDPDGDDPLTYEWSFGDGTTADTADATHTYAIAGTYPAKVTVTDARGARASKTIVITVTPAGGTGEDCFSGRSDDFLGDALDTDRWDASVRLDDDLSVTGGQLVIPLTATDIYGSNGTDTPNIVLQYLPGGAFEVTTKVTLEARRQYQQAGLILYGDDDNYMKMVVQGRTAEPDAAGRVMQFATEITGTATETNSPALGADFPDTAWLRMSSTDGLNVTASYSTDGTTFVDMTGTRSMAGINEPRVGLFGLVNNANAVPITAFFDNFRITPDDTATPCDVEPPTCFNGRSDGFDGDALDTDRWDRTVRLDQELSVSDSNLVIPLTATDIYGGNGTDTPNIVLQDLPGGAFEATTKVTLPARRQYQQAGLIVHADDDNYLKMVIQGRTAEPDASGRVFQFAKEVAGTASELNTSAIGADFPDTFWVRMTSPDGQTVTGSYSADGVTFTDMESTYTLEDIAEPAIGLFGLANSANALPITAEFDWFQLTPDDTAEPCDGEEPEDTTAPEVDSTVIGEYAGEVRSLVDTPIGGDATLVSSSAADGTDRSTTATLTLTGLEPGVGYESHLHVGTCDTLGLHYRDDPDGDGTPPNELWPTRDGWTAGTPRILADDDGEATAAATVAWAPRTEAGALVLHRDGGIVACATLGLTGAGTVVLDATDDADENESGIDTVEYRVDEGDWTAYDGPFVVDAPGTHTVDYRVRDVAGNTTRSSFEVVVPEPDVVEPVVPEVEVTTAPAPDGRRGWWVSPVELTATASGGVGDLVVEYKIDDGEWTTYDSPVVIDTDGSYVVKFRATGEDDTTSEVVSTDVNLDATAPEIEISGLGRSGKLGLAQVKTATVTASDATSGIANTVVTFDGDRVYSPIELDGFYLGRGRYRLVATAIDEAGNSRTDSTVIRVKVSYAGAKGLVRRVEADDRIAGQQADAMIRNLDKAQAKAEAGKTKQARKQLERFIKKSRRVRDLASKAALVDAGTTLRGRL